MKIVTKWLSNTSTVLALCWGALFVSSDFPGAAEGRIFPVIRNYKLEAKAHPTDPTKTVLSGFIERRRDCEFQGIEWKMNDDTETRGLIMSTRDVTLFVRVADDHIIQDKEKNTLSINNWVVDIRIDSRTMNNSNTYIIYTCHPFWNTRVPITPNILR